eukprot:601275-Amphidinium_carterae.1
MGEDSSQKDARLQQVYSNTYTFTSVPNVLSVVTELRFRAGLQEDLDPAMPPEIRDSISE